MVEVWKEVRGYEGLYEVSDLGRLRAISTRGNQMAGTLIRGFWVNGYRGVRLTKDGKQKPKVLHILVLEMFNPRPEGKYLIGVHDNGNRDDNRLENLVWCTHAEAWVRHNWQYCKGEAVPTAKLTAEAVREIRRLYKEGFGHVDIAPRFGVSKSTVGRVISGHVWSHVA